MAGVAFSFIIGEHGIFKYANLAKEQTNKETATEKMNLKIVDIQMEKYSKEQRMPTLQEFSDALCEDSEIEYVELQSKKLGSLSKINVGDASSIFTKLKEYSYEFEINTSLQIVSINPIKTTVDGGIRENDGTLFGIQATKGQGTQQNPYIIETEDQLLALSDLVNEGRSFEEKWFALGNDIILDNSKNWKPIGNSQTNCFKGNFDGRNHVIKGLYYNDTTTQYVGLFGFAIGSNIKNLTISSENSSINAGGVTGAVVGRIDNGTIENCTNETSVTINGGDSVGGIAGIITSCTVKNCTNIGNITGRISAGIVGYITAMDNGYCEILNCKNTGNILGTQTAGIASRVFNPSGRVLIKGCTTTMLSIYSSVVTPTDLTVED